MNKQKLFWYNILVKYFDNIVCSKHSRNAYVVGFSNSTCRMHWMCIIKNIKILISVIYNSRNYKHSLRSREPHMSTVIHEEEILNYGVHLCKNWHHLVRKRSYIFKSCICSPKIKIFVILCDSVGDGSP